ncbi:MAG: hypothetical protein M1818_002465 [Claussenomyces sp. TS43310]|nr:MAG: hypothetical protein M1818_002465 [Claussenomyces sp. TS43310]
MPPRAWAKHFVRQMGGPSVASPKTDQGGTLDDFIRSLASLPVEGVDEPPSKRRRLTPEFGGRDALSSQDGQFQKFDTVIVKQSSFSLTFPKSKMTDLAHSIRRERVPFTVSIRPSATEQYHIQIFDSVDRNRRLILDRILSGEDVPLEDIEIAMEAAAHAASRQNPQGPGRLWTEVSCEVGHSCEADYLQMSFSVKWNTTPSLEYIPIRQTGRPALQHVLERYFPDSAEKPTRNPKWSPQDFYASIHIPNRQDVQAEAIAPQLDTELYPFQKRTVRWLMNREGVDLDEKGRLIDLGECHEKRTNMPYSFHHAKDAAGHDLYISHLFNLITKNVDPFRSVERLRGGILAEEMGLGKSVEVISLISLHKLQKKDSKLVVDPLTKEESRQIAATLIVTPPTILHQWIGELNRHAPSLKVMHYEGINAYRSNMDASQLSNEFASCDVVLTTYNVLASEIHYTLPPPNRVLRNKAKYARPKSPLTMNQWWRVCLDEAQMVESGVSNAAKVAKLIPRVNAWGVSGTPVKKDVADLLGLLNFLRLEPYATLRHLWTLLVTSHRASFKAIFGQLALRHTKKDVRDELRLPGQQRFVITIPFTPIEEQYYQSLFQQMCEDCGLNLQGGPLDDDWNPEESGVIERMRSWLVRLRQSALHPEIGGRNRRALGTKDGPLRTVDEVLEAMLDQSDISIRADQRNLLLSRLKRGQMLENGPRVREALEIWSDVLNEASAMVLENRSQLQREIDSTRSEEVRENGDVNKDVDFSDAVDDEGIESGVPFGQEASTRIGTLRNRLRGAIEIEHMAVFYRANAFFQIKSNAEMTEPDSPEFASLEKLEIEGYELAKKLRQEILKEIFKKANRLMRQVAKKASSQAFIEIPEFSHGHPKGGIESRRPVEQFLELGAALDLQANQLDEWREQTIQFLLRPLVDEDDGVEITGEEYEESTKTQDEVMVYISALRAVVEDRHDALSGQDNILVKSEVKTALRMAKDGEGAFPEKVLELYKTRQQIKPTPDMSSLRGIVSELRAIATTLKAEADSGSSRAKHELSILEHERSKIQKQLQDQNKAVIGLRQEIDLFTGLMNTRLEYYRQLQQVSDTVALLEEDQPQKSYESMLADEQKLGNKIATAVAKRRYLLHLRDEAEQSKEQRMCIICQETFELGSLTVCGHQFCKDCILLWRQEHQNCPVCKRRLRSHDLYDITYKPQELKVAEENIEMPSESSRGVNRSAIYSDISNSTLAQIKNVELEGPSFTTKIDTLARHLIWLRESDPGSKSIIFSQFKEFLDILSRALTAFRIGHTSIDKAGGIERFKRDPAIECFLLHAKSQSSGLNLVNASHVFLCEPLLNTALELQAIARVDRIGQHQQTSVYLYLIDGTVEESIYAMSVRRRFEHMAGGQTLEQPCKGEGNGKSKDKGKAIDLPQPPDDQQLLDSSIEAANSLELQQAPLANLLTKGKLGGEVVDQSDLWECLFGNAQNREARRVAGARRRVTAEVRGDKEREVRRFLGAHAAESRVNDEDADAMGE